MTCASNFLDFEWFFMPFLTVRHLYFFQFFLYCFEYYILEEVVHQTMLLSPHIYDIPYSVSY